MLFRAQSGASGRSTRPGCSSYSGHARIGLLNAFPGEAVFLEDEETTVQAGAVGMQALIAYEASRPDMMMLRPLSGSDFHPAGVASPPVAALSAMSQLLSRSALEVRT